MLIWCFIFAISIFAYGQEKFNVSGEITFHEQKGEILVWLKTQEEFEKNNKIYHIPFKFNHINLFKDFLRISSHFSTLV